MLKLIFSALSRPEAGKAAQDPGASFRFRCTALPAKAYFKIGEEKADDLPSSCQVAKI